MNFRRLKDDAKYILLNMVVMRFPAWTVRRFFLRKMGMKIGNGSRIGINCVVVNPSGIVIGERTIVNEFCHLDGRGGLYIGDNCSISVYAKIITATHMVNSKKFDYAADKTIIESNVWLGCQAIILNESYIERGSVIGAGCVFKGRTESNGVYVGNPARLIKRRDEMMDYTINYNPYFR